MSARQQLFYYLPEQNSPTQYNLARYLQEAGWLPGPSPADFSIAQLDFHEQAALCLEYKHLLAELIAAQNPELMPLTFRINDHNWPQVLGRIAASLPHLDRFRWILKPSMLNNGQHIHLFHDLNELEAHFSSSQRMGGEQVLQQYIARPHLLRDHRKYSIRLFMILSHKAGAWLYPKGYFNVARHPFAGDNYEDIRSHVSNEHLYADAPNTIQIPSERFEFFPPLYAQIKNMLTQLIAGLRARYPAAFDPNQPDALALFGVDFIVDEQGRVWLLECNHGPCFPISDEHSLQAHLYRDFWRALVNCFVIPMAKPSPDVSQRVVFFDQL
ncbi:YheC/YheD family protein [Legionella sp. CNM-4043-24]|uniref:YheC/YheD family protein n=1 Tax=Legionella sp. CNM-4043-24 TaxID=3421646 RepID=UPI00403ABDFC